MTKMPKPFGRVLLLAATAIGCWMPTMASAQERGCVVLVCLAGNWKNIPMCGVPVRQTLRDLARGRPFPRCDMSGNGNQAQLQWSSVPAFCPPQYTQNDSESGRPSFCDYAGAITLTVGGDTWSRVWFNFAGDDSATEYFAPARAQLGVHIDPKFDRDYAAYRAALPPAPVCTGGDC
jgi:hypothetical protein